MTDVANTVHNKVLKTAESKISCFSYKSVFS